MYGIIVLVVLDDVKFSKYTALSFALKRSNLPDTDCMYRGSYSNAYRHCKLSRLMWIHPDYPEYGRQARQVNLKKDAVSGMPLICLFLNIVTCYNKEFVSNSFFSYHEIVIDNAPPTY